MSELKAPRVQHYIDWMRHLDYGRMDFNPSYDERSYDLLDELFQELRKIQPMGDRNRRELWLRADRGNLEDWGNINEMVEDGEFDCCEDAESYWQDMFPEEEYWYHLMTIEDDDTGFRGLFLGHQYIIEVDHREPKSIFSHNISDLVNWILSEVKHGIQEVKEGIYNSKIRDNLPLQHRFGTIVRKDLYDIFPEERQEFFEGLSSDDRQEFIRLAASAPPEHRLATMTANNFYSFCSYGYAANEYAGGDLTPKEQYYLHADGRDDGLGEISQDDPDAFHDWVINRNRWGGHPWEVCRGGNSTHISLYVCTDDNGYYLCLAGSSWGRTIETVKFYLALYRRGLPVCLREAASLVERMLESEKIGIVPKGILPAYCGSYFPGEHIISFRNLPDENREEVARHCVWQNPTEAFLA